LQGCLKKKVGPKSYKVAKVGGAARAARARSPASLRRFCGSLHPHRLQLPR